VIKKTVFLLLTLLSLLGCARTPSRIHLASSATPPVEQTNPAEHGSVWSIFHPDPNHLWNRVFRQFYRRTTTSGEEYGADELDPLLWFDTTHLLTGEPHWRTIQILDEFLSSRGENLIRDPLRRAMFQRDLWAVFDWLSSQAEPYPAARRALATRLAQLITRVALSKEEILSLPDNYAITVEAKIYPTAFPADHSEEAFLPADLFQPDGGWVPLGREGGPVAMTHTEAFPFFGRSVFLVLVRSPDGRQATLDFIESLNTQRNPVTATGSEVALVRGMLLIDDQGDIILSPLVETIQIRHFSPVQSFYEFELNRGRLFDTLASGLVLNNDLFMLFMGHGDVFEIPGIPYLQAEIPEICKTCHFHDPSIPNSADTGSIISYSRHPFALPDDEQPVLFATTVMDEAQAVIDWKQKHVTWNVLEALWERRSVNQERRPISLR
jgi:hypothetical protein